MYLDKVFLWLLVATCSCAERWTWPDDDSAAEDSVRIDSKVDFSDQQRNIKRNSNIQSDEFPFQEATDTEGFYNRPQGVGRYPVRVEPAFNQGIRINGQAVFLNGPDRNPNYESDGTLDSLQHCKCVSRPDCDVRDNDRKACGTNQYLCCYNQPRQQHRYPSESFNEVENERPVLSPNQANSFPDELFRPNQGTYKQGVLVGPRGPTGSIGPQNNNQVLVGPDGPTGLIGPQGSTKNLGNTKVLVGPNSPTGDIGLSETAQRGVLVGPGGPTGNIGPAINRPVLVGPGGPTGIIGPRRPGQGILVGPGGFTGMIGPAGFNRNSGRPVLVGPSGPTGIIGPGRQILFGPGGPTGRIGPNNYFN